MKIQENMISSQNELFNEKFYILQIFESKIEVAQKTWKMLYENLSSNNFKFTNLKRSFHKLEQYSCEECVELLKYSRIFLMSFYKMLSASY